MTAPASFCHPPRRGDALHRRLERLRRTLPQLLEALDPALGAELDPWCRAIDRRLLARFDPRFPLVAAICGGGSAGKSTLFNALAGGSFSPVGARAGMNRRVLFAVPPPFAATRGFLEALGEPFGASPRPLASPEELFEPGDPRFVHSAPGAPPVILIDTPDFDTGGRGEYVNRPAAQAALEAADLLIYLFTNATYANRDNTEFIARMLTGIGRRRCLLVYRCYASYTAAEVEEHAQTVARNLYGEDFGPWIAGRFRLDEDNRVAEGRRPPRVLALDDGGPGLAETLLRIDAGALRREIHAATLADVERQAADFTARARAELERLEGYREALLQAQGRAIRRALAHFPMETVVRRFAAVWAAGDPPAVKFMRRAGAVVEFPFRAVLGLFKGGGRRASAAGDAPDPEQAYARRLEEDLAAAVTGLHQEILQPLLPIAAEGGGGSAARIAVPAAMRPALDDFSRKPFREMLAAVLARREEIGGVGPETEGRLEGIARHFRARMGLREKTLQTFWASLNVLPAAAAVTWVLTTGDAVGGATLKVKLAGLFGAKDLYALVAIPVTHGLKEADRRQLEEMLSPIAAGWLEESSARLQAVLEEHLTASLLRRLGEILAEGRTRADTIDADLSPGGGPGAGCDDGP
ncbi:MAG: GTPase domain-containing protein [Desulfobacterales bacterium]